MVKLLNYWTQVGWSMRKQFYSSFNLPENLNLNIPLCASAWMYLNSIDKSLKDLRKNAHVVLKLYISLIDNHLLSLRKNVSLSRPHGIWKITVLSRSLGSGTDYFQRCAFYCKNSQTLLSPSEYSEYYLVWFWLANPKTLE